MVQRKVPKKLGLQADHVKTEDLLQHQDVKNNRGPDLKKKMKKSGSIKRQELDSLRSPNLRRHVIQPGKPPPPPPAVLSSAAIPQKQSPNYMKSTTSSDARKEQSQVSTKSPHHTSPDSSSLRRKSSNSSKLTLASGNKATKTLARTSSLKMMRTLTKNPSFKPARASVRKCSPVVLCENLDAQKATCSSTLKDCKFPAYLSLDPGGTESEGTSIIKVCPYTYCSLNGHHHAPLPPLKCFLSARRRMLKTQRSIKLGCLSPRRVKGFGDGPSFDGKLVMQDDLKSSRISPLTEEEHKDFFIEIYSKENDDSAAEYTGIDGSASHSSIIDIHETLDQNGDVNSMDMGTTYFSEQNEEVKVDDEVSPPLLVQEEREQGFLSELPVENMPNVQFYEIDSEASDMDWETGHDSGLHLDYDYEYSPETEIEPDPEAGKVESHFIHEEYIIKSDNKDGCFDEFLVDEVPQESFDEESLYSDAFSNSDDGESAGSYDNMKTSAPVEVPVEEPEPEPACDDKNHILFECQTPRIGLPIGNQGTGYYMIGEEETSFDNLKHKSLPNEDSIAVMGDQVSNFLKGPLDETVTCGSKAMCDTIINNVVSNQTSSDEGHQVQTELSDEENHQNSTENFITSSPIDSAKEPHPEVARLKSADADRQVREAKAKNAAKQETEDSALARATAKCKKPIQDRDELELFNPRAPNFLPVEPDPEAEKVDLRHQDLDEKKNAEEWMVDYALRQAVTKLGPARKRKVALLVEAFEKVMPITKCELQLRHSSAFDQARPMQACS
ncbi:hypothetical protein Pfo_005502 [Paulownia fortunei]|nr:hypothetical protein Pfo_005502 [Paulownia fortunei]